MGFFSDAQLALANPAGCGMVCTLCRSCHTPKMGLVGGGRKGILIIAETPGSDEDVTGKQLIGNAGQKLRKELSSLGVNIDTDCWKMNAVSCHPPEGRNPTDVEVNACRPNVLRTIAKYKPRLIILLGSAALESVVGSSNPEIIYRKSRGFPLLRGKIFPDRAYSGSWLGCTFHPAYVERMSRDKVVEVTWRNDLRRFLEQMEQAPPVGTAASDLSCCTLLTCPQQIIPVLQRMTSTLRPFTFDYETTGLKPHADGHHIVSIGFAVSTTTAFSFRLGHGPEWESVHDAWRSCMVNPQHGKIAHNLPFEFEWSRVGFGKVPRGWIADTQVLAHVEDSRLGHSSLKVQAYLKFGVPDYVSAVDKYKKPQDKDNKAYGCNAFNTMAKAPTTALLQYNALDALYTYRLWNYYREQGVAAPADTNFEFYG